MTYSLVESIFNPAVIKAENSTLQRPSAWFLDWFHGGRHTATGEQIDSHRAMALPEYFDALRIISEDIGKLPFTIFERLSPRGRQAIRDHPATVLIELMPNDEMTPITFKETLGHWALGWGNGYAEIVRRSDGIPVALHPIHPSRVRIKRDKSMKIFYEVRGAVTERNGRHAEGVTLRPENMLHIHGLGNGLEGYSILHFAAESLSIGLAAQTFGAAFFGNGTTLSGVLTHPEKLSPEAIENLRNSWTDLHGGAHNASRPAILEEGMKYERLGIPPEEAQFLLTREFSVTTVARWFRIPPHKLADLIRATFDNITEQNIEYVNDTLTPWAVRWEQEIERKLLMPDERMNLFAKFNFFELLRGDPKTRMEVNRGKFNTASITPNEIREEEGRNPDPSPAADKLYLQSNTLPIDSMEEMVQQNKTTRTNFSTILEAQTPIINDMAKRVLRIWVKATSRAVKKYENKTELKSWLVEFFDKQKEHFVELFEPIINATLQMRLDLNEGDVHQVFTEGIASEICAGALMRLFAEIESGDIVATLETWEQVHSGSITSKIVKLFEGE